MKLEISRCKINLKAITIFGVLVALVVYILTIISELNIPGLAPIALGMALLALGIKEFNNFKERKGKSNLILEILWTFLFCSLLYDGIIEIQKYISNL